MVGNGKSSALPDALVRCRTNQDLSLHEVGRAVGLSVAALSNIERGLARPRRTTRLRLVAFLEKHGYEVAEEEVVA